MSIPKKVAGTFQVPSAESLAAAELSSRNSRKTVLVCYQGMHTRRICLLPDAEDQSEVSVSDL